MDDITSESFCFFELDCDNLVLPKRSSRTTKSPLSRIHVYNLEPVGDSYQISHAGIRERTEESKVVGVINPYIFKEYAKRMLVTFINVAKYGALSEKTVEQQGFECYSVLGHNDMMVTHLHQDPSDLFFGIREMMGWNPSFLDGTEIGSAEDGDSAKYAYFEVFTYHKVLGIKVGPAHRTAFRDGTPTSEQLSSILALGKNWNDVNVLDDERDFLLNKKWILGSTTKEPGNIDAVMTIYLDHPEDLRVPMQIFEDYVLPSLMSNGSVTSIYEGTGRKMAINYLLRITGSKDNLFAFIQDVHRLAISARLMIMTNTFVIVKKWSSLDLEKSLLIPVLPANEETYRNTHIVNKMTLGEKVKFISLSREAQLTLIEAYREFESKLNALGNRLKLNQQLPDIQRDFIVGLLNEDFSVLRHPHDELQGHVEVWLRETIGALVSDKNFPEIRDAVGIEKNKTKDKLTYAEWLLISIYCSEQSLTEPKLLPIFKDLLDNTTYVRNAIKHDEWSKLAVKPYVTALSAYFAFLLNPQVALTKKIANGTSFSAGFASSGRVLLNRRTRRNCGWTSHPLADLSGKILKWSKRRIRGRCYGIIRAACDSEQLDTGCDSRCRPDSQVGLMATDILMLNRLGDSRLPSNFSNAFPALEAHQPICRFRGLIRLNKSIFRKYAALATYNRVSTKGEQHRTISGA